MRFVDAFLCCSFILALCAIDSTARAEDENKIKVITDWSDDERPIRVDCENIGIMGDGFGGAQLSCSDRLSLYATFSCFPMKKEQVEASCPNWEGLNASIDWERVAKLIDARADEEAEKKRQLMPEKGHANKQTSNDRK